MTKSRKDNKGRVLRRGECQRTSDNHYLYTYTDSAGKRRMIHDADLLKLREKEKALQRDIMDGIDSHMAASITFEQMYHRWMETKRTVRVSTQCTYQNNYRLHIEDVFGKRKVSSIKFSDILTFYNSLILDKDMKIKTLELVHTVIHGTMQLAVRDGVIRMDPSLNAFTEAKKNQTNLSDRHALEIEQQKAFLKYIRDNDNYKFWYHVFVFLLGTGCRIGEALGLRWDDVDFENRVIDINHQLTRIYIREDRRGVARITPPKNMQSIRKIPMLNEVYNVLLEEYEYQKRNGFCKDKIDDMTNFVFFINDYHVLNSGTCNEAIKRIVREYNETESRMAKETRRDPILLPHFSVHNLRHTFCTRLCENEDNIKYIQALMGHSNIHTTMKIYAEATERRKKKTIETLDGKIEMF